MNVLLGVTGSVAAKLTLVLVDELQHCGFQVKAVATEPSLFFWNQSGVQFPVYRNRDEWPAEYIPKSPILHIDLRNWADTLVIAPLSANTLAKMANGIADNLLTSIVRAWDRSKKVIIAPAMNTHMWDHPATKEHLDTLMRWYPHLTIVNPINKLLECGDVGIGAMAEVHQIVEEVKKCAH
ncbi:MAG: phosphopantothenoylcysteine decarboxylase [Candidatus Yanofskybacteria bacterium]|nr:phosphopantothenoylcysteine decarboxylase [Candidatus Yanofskybacteria bacterium]